MNKAKRILALIGVIILVAMYLITLILAFMSSPASKGMLMASIGCTIVVPCLIYGMMIIARVLNNRNDKKEHSDSGK